MIKLQKSSLVLILIIVVLTAGCVSIYTLGYAPGTVSHKAEDVKSGTFGSNVGSGNYNFPGNVGIKKTNPSSELDVTGNIYVSNQVTAGTKFAIGGSSLTGTALTVASGGTSSIGGNLNITGNVGIGTTNPQAKLDVNGAIKIGYRDYDFCNANTAGAIRYNPTRKKHDYCDGQYWTAIGETCGENVTFTYKGSTVTYGTVKSVGRCWLDRNLGASQVATAFNDSAAYGDLFQWGRLDDGHQNRNSLITTTLSSTDVPGHSKFILGSASPDWYYDWQSPYNYNLWQPDSGINNPCPSGWRVPTSGEWTLEWRSWVGHDHILAAMNSPLKLPAAGMRAYFDGIIYNTDQLDDTPYKTATVGRYWSSNGIQPPLVLNFESGGAHYGIWTSYTANGHSVRCIKD